MQATEQAAQESSLEFTSRRLVLGFDAGCTACSDLAQRIENQAGDKLEVRSLRDTQVEHWRRQALGEDTVWAPTLIEVQSGEVKAWTGPKMCLNLSRFLGPIATWQVMQALVEAGKERKRLKQTSMTTSGMSRSEFLLKGATGVGGAAVGFGVLSASGLASPAHAATNTKSAELTAEQEEVKREFVKLSQQTSSGQEFTLVNENGKELAFRRTAEGVAPVDSSMAQSSFARGICFQAARAAIYTIGAAAFAGVAATGGTILVAGVTIGPKIAAAIAAALTGGAGLEGLIAAYIC